MVDSVQVFPAGFRVLDADGAPVANAKIKFHDAGPGDAKEVFSDAALATSLGTTVYTRSDGYPCASFGSNTTTLVYVDENAYHIEITDEDDAVIFPAKDNVRGALDTSGFLTAASASTLLLLNSSLLADTLINSTYNGKIINVDPTSVSLIALTFDQATTLGNGFNCELHHSGTSGYVRVTGTDNFNGPWGLKNSFSLRPGQSVIVRCNGSNFPITAVSPTRIGTTVGVIEIVDRVSAAPSFNNPGDRYICTAAFTSGGVTTAIGDIIENTGFSTWIKYTPSTDCGWLAFVQDENELYQFRDSTWTQLLTINASQADQEAGSSAVRNVTPSVQQAHPSAAKCWLYCNNSGTINASYNITSISDAGTGNVGVTIATDFSSASYEAVACCANSAAAITFLSNQFAGSITVFTTNVTPTLVDVSAVYFSAHGDQ